MFGWLDKAVDRGVKAGVERALDNAKKPGGVIEKAISAGIEKIALKNKRYHGYWKPEPFTWLIAFELIRKGDLKGMEAKRKANDILTQWLKDEKIEYGDPAYSWDQEAAEILADEYELRHGESS